MQESLYSLFVTYLPWIAIAVLILVFGKLLFWAKNKKTGAIVFGVLIQMIMPEPYAERTIKVVQEEKKVSKEKEQEGD
ncbi:MAG: hypothetical protein KUG78_06935 [Kangiellaceae bacterium]|nr:hypothetical protein [Kangiellaceae bacterium]